MKQTPGTPPPPPAHGGGGQHLDFDGVPTNTDINALWRSHRRYCRSYKEAQRKVRMHKLLKKVAWLIFTADIWFSYKGVAAYSGSQEFGLTIALIIGAIQFAISEAILARSLGGVMRLDQNNDGEISIAEWVRGGMYLFALICAYLFDIATNMLAIDTLSLGAVPFQLLDFEATGWVSHLGALCICAMLTFADEIIHSLSDNRLGELDAEIPILRKRAAIIEGQLEAAGEFNRAYIARAREAGRRQGEHHPI